MQLLDRSERRQQIAQRFCARRHRRGESFDPHGGNRGAGVGDITDRRQHRHRQRQVGGGGDLVARIERRRHCPPRRFVGEAVHQNRADFFRRRQHLDGDFGERRQGAVGAGHQLRQIVAGDVLDHPAAALDRLAAPADAGNPQHVIARRAGLETPRPGQIAGNGTAQRAALIAVEAGHVHRLEGQLLALVGDGGLDLGERRAGARAQHQLFGLVERNTGELRQIEGVADLAVTLAAMGPEQRPAEAAFRCRAGDLQRHFLADRPGNGLGHLGGVRRLQNLAHRP